MPYSSDHPPLSPLPEVPTPPLPPFTQREHEPTPLRTQTPVQAGSSPPPTASSKSTGTGASPAKALPSLPPSRAPRPGPLQMPVPAQLNPSISRIAVHQGQFTMSPVDMEGATIPGPQAGAGATTPGQRDRDGHSSRWAIDVNGGYRSPGPPAPVWRMPSFRRSGTDKHVRQSRGVDISGGPTPDERVSRYGRLRGFSAYVDAGNGNAHAVPISVPKNAPQRPLTVAERLMPTLELARQEREKCAYKGIPFLPC
jgi:hypothetical protein